MSTVFRDRLTHRFEQNRCMEKAPQMQRYMKTDQPFYGIQSRLRKKLVAEQLSLTPIHSAEEFESIVLDLWRHSHRESQYAALDIALRLKRFQADPQWPLYRTLVFSASWWDTLDLIASNLVGTVLKAHREHQPELDEWAQHDSLWVRRASLLAHLKHRQQTDTHALERTMLQLTTDRQFFIQKAIGWALREYSKTDSGWVRDFIGRYGERLSPLAIREGSKYLP